MEGILLCFPLYLFVVVVVVGCQQQHIHNVKRNYFRFFFTIGMKIVNEKLRENIVRGALQRG